MPRKTPKPISEQLRNAIDASGLSRYAICKEIGWAQSNMSRFMAGRSGLSWPAADRLGLLLGLRIVADGAKKKGR